MAYSACIGPYNRPCDLKDADMRVKIQENEDNDVTEPTSLQLTNSGNQLSPPMPLTYYNKLRLFLMYVLRVSIYIM